MNIQHYKYPRTSHLPWSPGFTDDDIFTESTENFVDNRTIATLKMDGENSSLYTDHYHARSLDSRDHPSRAWLKRKHGEIAHNIPAGWRICGENMYARHSIAYDDLKSYFYVFSIWNEKNVCLSWDETVEYASLLGLETVPVLYDGIYDEAHIKTLWDASKADVMEGYVVRLADSFAYGDFKKSVAKFVKPNHVQTSSHWMHEAVVPNKLKVD